jgi:hypothetical protein
MAQRLSAIVEFGPTWAAGSMAFMDDLSAKCEPMDPTIQTPTRQVPHTFQAALILANSAP